MKVDLRTLNSRQIISHLAGKIRSERQRLGHSQQSFARLAGIPFRTYKRLELSGKGTIYNLIRVLQASERIRALELLFSSPPSPRPNVIDKVKELANRVQTKYPE